MKLSTVHEVMPNASAFADVLGSDLVAKTTWSDRVVSFKAVRLPALKVPSGRITASDGYILDSPPFTQAVPPGEHPLTLLIAIIENDERIAFAHLQFAPAPAARWEMALRPGQDPTTLKPGEIYGYGVDSGTGCFGDSKAYEMVNDAGQEFATEMMEEAQKVYLHTRDWLSVDTPLGSLAVFSSGYGDGFYPSYFGFSAEGGLVSLITDFGLAEWAMS